MKPIIIGLLIALAGCKHTGIDLQLPETKPIQVPELPAELAKPAQKLPPLTDNTMGGRELDAVETDKKYNEVVFQVNNLIVFYKCVRQSVNERKDLERCLNP